MPPVGIDSDGAYIPGVNFTDRLDTPTEPALGHSLVYTSGGQLYIYKHGGPALPVVGVASVTENALGVGNADGIMVALTPGAEGAVPTRQSDGTIAEVVPTAPGGGDLSLIEAHSTPSGGETSYTFANITGTSSHLRLLAKLRCDRASVPADVLLLRLNGDSTVAYTYGVTNSQNGQNVGVYDSDGATSLCVGNATAATAPANEYADLMVDIPWYSSAAFFKTVHFLNAMRYGASGLKYRSLGDGSYLHAQAITSITLLLTTGGAKFLEGCRFALYGIA